MGPTTGLMWLDTFPRDATSARVGGLPGAEKACMAAELKYSCQSAACQDPPGWLNPLWPQEPGGSTAGLTAVMGPWTGDPIMLPTLGLFQMVGLVICQAAPPKNLREGGREDHQMLLPALLKPPAALRRRTNLCLFLFPSGGRAGAKIP